MIAVNTAGPCPRPPSDSVCADTSCSLIGPAPPTGCTPRPVAPRCSLTLGGSPGLSSSRTSRLTWLTQTDAKLPQTKPPSPPSVGPRCPSGVTQGRTCGPICDSPFLSSRLEPAARVTGQEGTWDSPLVVLLGPGRPLSGGGQGTRLPPQGKTSQPSPTPWLFPKTRAFWGCRGSQTWGRSCPSSPRVRVSGEGAGSDLLLGSERCVGHAFAVLWPRRDSLHLTVPHPRPLPLRPAPWAPSLTSPSSPASSWGPVPCFLPLGKP